MQPTPPPSGERWNVNMPAVIGVVFVFLVGVVVWVVVTSGDGDDTTDAGDEPAPVSTGDVSSGATTLPTITTPPSLSPTPLPTTTTPTPTPATTAPTTAPTTPPTTAPTTPPATEPPPVTAAPGADDGAVPGDLAVPGVPMQRPPCDGGFITILASAIGSQATGPGIATVLDQYPGSNYLRTDQTCPSLSQDADGAPIYVVFFGPFVFASDACAARADGPDGAYARELSNDLGPDHSVDCS